MRFNPFTFTPPAATKSLLPVGTRVRTHRWVRANGIIIALSTDSFDYSIVFGGESPRKTGLNHDNLMDTQDFTILEGIATADDIAAAVKLLEDHLAAEKIAAADKDKKLAEERAALPALHPYLETRSQSKKSGYALGAANIKVELARAFPGIPFSVSSRSFSMGNAIDVRWTCGPTTDDVEAITGKYQQGSFDGMTDSYNYDSDRTWTDVFGGAKYVHESRRVDDVFDLVCRLICEQRGLTFEGQYTKGVFGTDDSQDVGHYAHQLISQTTFAPAFRIKAVESACGLGVRVHFKIIFDESIATIPKMPAAAAAQDGQVTFTENHAKNLLELRFPGKPNEATRNELKTARWRWFGPSGCWYNRDNPVNRQFAAAFLERQNGTKPSIPETVDVPEATKPVAIETTAPVPATPAPANPFVPAWRRRLIVSQTPIR